MENYIIVSSLDLDMLVDLVNKKIKLGYVPCGSIILDNFNHFAQPMIKSSLLISEQTN